MSVRSAAQGSYGGDELSGSSLRRDVKEVADRAADPVIFRSKGSSSFLSVTVGSKTFVKRSPQSFGRGPETGS